MQGDSVEATQAQDDWLAMCEKHMCHLLKELRGHTQQRLKTLVGAWHRKHGNAMPLFDLLLALIRRNFPIQEGETLALAQGDCCWKMWLFV